MLLTITGLERGRNGLGAYTAYVNGDLQTFGDSPCAPGLEFIGGSCFRAPGTQETPYGVVPMPIAGPQANNATAAAILGGGAVCKTERVDAGPYAYEQNVCRDANGTVIVSADLEAEAAYARRLLQTLGQPTGGGTVRAVVPTPAPTPTPSAANYPSSPNALTAPTPVQTGTYSTPVGGAANARPHQPTAVTTAAPPTASTWMDNLPGNLLGQLSTPPWLAIAAGVGLLFVLPAVFKGDR